MKDKITRENNGHDDKTGAHNIEDYNMAIEDLETEVTCVKKKDLSEFFICKGNDIKCDYGNEEMRHTL